MLGNELGEQALIQLSMCCKAVIQMAARGPPMQALGLVCFIKYKLIQQDTRLWDLGAFLLTL